MNPIKHGTQGGYTNRGCRCDLCTEANRLAGERQRRRNGARPMGEYLADVTHHGWSRYKKGGCRCAICKAAAAAQKRRQRANNVERYRDLWREQKRRQRGRQAA